jgi:hypothetical protein
VSTTRRTTWRRRSALLVAGLVIVVLAYVCGRAVGILLDLNPYVTETAAVALVLVAAAWARTRGDRGE